MTMDIKSIRKIFSIILAKESGVVFFAMIVNSCRHQLLVDVVVLVQKINQRLKCMVEKYGETHQHVCGLLSNQHLITFIILILAPYTKFCTNVHFIIATVLLSTEKERTTVALRRPCVLIKKLPIKSLYKSSSDSGSDRISSTANLGENGGCESNKSPSCVNHMYSSNSESGRRYTTYSKSSSDLASDRRSTLVNHRVSSDTPFNCSDSETSLSDEGADRDGDSRADMDWENWEQDCQKTFVESHLSVGPSTSPGGFQTPAQLPTEADKPDPKQARVMGSIARKKRFLTGSPTSSDDSSCSFLSLKKLRQAKRSPQSFASPEIPLATCRHASLAHHRVHNEMDLSNGTTDKIGIAPPTSILPTGGGVQVSGQENVPHVITSLTEKMGPGFFKNLGEWINEQWTCGKPSDGGGVGGCGNATISSFESSSEPLSSSKQPTTVTSSDMVTRSVARHLLHTNRRRRVKKRTMTPLEQDCDFVSDTDSESPLNNKSSPLHGLNGTLRKTH